MNRFELVEIPLSDFEGLIDNVTGESWQVHKCSSYEICQLLNDLSDKSDTILESFTTEEMLKLKWQRDIYQRFSKETMKILEKYEISSLEKLDRILFEKGTW